MTSCRDVCYNIVLSTIAQLVERLTVNLLYKHMIFNHDVTGSSPVGGVRLLLLDEKINLL